MGKVKPVKADGTEERMLECVCCGGDGSNLPPGVDPNEEKYYWHVVDLGTGKGICGPCALRMYRGITFVHNQLAKPLVAVMEPKPGVAVVRGL